MIKELLEMELTYHKIDEDESDPMVVECDETLKLIGVDCSLDDQEFVETLRKMDITAESFMDAYDGYKLSDSLVEELDDVLDSIKEELEVNEDSIGS